MFGYEYWAGTYALKIAGSGRVVLQTANLMPLPLQIASYLIFTNWRKYMEESAASRQSSDMFV